MARLDQNEMSAGSAEEQIQQQYISVNDDFSVNDDLKLVGSTKPAETTSSDALIRALILGENSEKVAAPAEEKSVKKPENSAAILQKAHEPSMAEIWKSAANDANDSASPATAVIEISKFQNAKEALKQIRLAASEFTGGDDGAKKKFEYLNRAFELLKALNIKSFSELEDILPGFFQECISLKVKGTFKKDRASLVHALESVFKKTADKSNLRLEKFIPEDETRKSFVAFFGDYVVEEVIPGLLYDQQTREEFRLANSDDRSQDARQTFALEIMELLFYSGSEQLRMRIRQIINDSNYCKVETKDSKEKSFLSLLQLTDPNKIIKLKNDQAGKVKGDVLVQVKSLSVRDYSYLVKQVSQWINIPSLKAQLGKELKVTLESINKLEKEMKLIFENLAGKDDKELSQDDKNQLKYFGQYLPWLDLEKDRLNNSINGVTLETDSLPEISQDTGFLSVIKLYICHLALGNLEEFKKLMKSDGNVLHLFLTALGDASLVKDFTQDEFNALFNLLESNTAENQIGYNQMLVAIYALYYNAIGQAGGEDTAKTENRTLELIGNFIEHLYADADSRKYTLAQTTVTESTFGVVEKDKHPSIEAERKLGAEIFRQDKLITAIMSLRKLLKKIGNKQTLDGADKKIIEGFGLNFLQKISDALHRNNPDDAACDFVYLCQGRKMANLGDDDFKLEVRCLGVEPELGKRTQISGYIENLAMKILLNNSCIAELNLGEIKHIISRAGELTLIEIIEHISEGASELNLENMKKLKQAVISEPVFVRIYYGYNEKNRAGANKFPQTMTALFNNNYTDYFNALCEEKLALLANVQEKCLQALILKTTKEELPQFYTKLYEYISSFQPKSGETARNIDGLIKVALQSDSIKDKELVSLISKLTDEGKWALLNDKQVNSKYKPALCAALPDKWFAKLGGKAVGNQPEMDELLRKIVILTSEMSEEDLQGFYEKISNKSGMINNILLWFKLNEKFIEYHKGLINKILQETRWKSGDVTDDDFYLRYLRVYVSLNANESFLQSMEEAEQNAVYFHLLLNHPESLKHVKSDLLNTLVQRNLKYTLDGKEPAILKAYIDMGNSSSEFHITPETRQLLRMQVLNSKEALEVFYPPREKYLKFLRSCVNAEKGNNQQRSINDKIINGYLTKMWCKLRKDEKSGRKTPEELNQIRSKLKDAIKNAYINKLGNGFISNLVWKWHYFWNWLRPSNEKLESRAQESLRKPVGEMQITTATDNLKASVQKLEELEKKYKSTDSSSTTDNKVNNELTRGKEVKPQTELVRKEAGVAPNSCTISGSVIQTQGVFNEESSCADQGESPIVTTQK